MKIAISIILLIALLAGAGYYVLPVLIEKETGNIQSDIQDLKQRIQKIEEFVKSEEEVRKITGLKPGTDINKVINAVNAVSLKVTSLENSFNKGMTSADEAVKKQKAITEEALKRQSEAIDKLNKETLAKLQKIMFDAKMANIRGHIAKARTDLLSRNIGTAKTELELINGVFETLKTSAPDENKKTVEELQTILKKARTEIDIDLPATINKIDLLWHEMSKLLRES